MIDILKKEVDKVLKFAEKGYGCSINRAHEVKEHFNAGDYERTVKSIISYWIWTGGDRNIVHKHFEELINFYNTGKINARP